MKFSLIHRFVVAVRLAAAFCIFLSASAVQATETYTLDLKQGWNLVGNSIGQTLDVTSPTLYGDPSKVISVWKWNARDSYWLFYAPSMTTTELQSYAASRNYGVLSQISPADGYWVNAKTSFSLDFSGQNWGTSTLPGWNLLAVGGCCASAAGYKADHDPQADIVSIWAWDSALSKWYFYAPSLDVNGTLDSYIASKGYLSFSQQSKLLGNGVGFWVNVAGTYILSRTYSGNSETVKYNDGSTVVNTATSSTNIWSNDNRTRTTVYGFADGTTNSVSETVAGGFLFAPTPILLPDLRAKYDSLCGNNVSVQTATAVNLTGHKDGKKDLVFNLWCSQVDGTVTTTPTVNGVVAFIQQADGSFVDGTRILFGVDMVDLIGVGGESVVYDFNNDGKDDMVFAVTGEDGRSLPNGFTGRNRQNVFLTSKSDGTYSVQRIGEYSYNARIALVDNELGGKDVSISTIGYGGTNTVWRYTNGWQELPANNWVAGMQLFFKRTEDNIASSLAVTQAIAGISLYTRTDATAWDNSSNWSFPNPTVVPWLAWNGDLGNASMVTFGGKDYVSVVFESGCELRMKPTDTETIAIVALSTNEIVGGYKGGTIIESSSYLQSLTKLMAFSVANRTLTNIDLPINNEVTNVMFFRISCGDLNGDSNQDIMIKPWGKNAVPLIYINDGAGGFDLVDLKNLPTPSTDFQGTTMLYEDIDGDGIPDLLYWPLTSVAGNPSQIQFQIYKGRRNINKTDLKQ